MRNYKIKLKINRGFKFLVVVLTFAFCVLSLMLTKSALAASASLYLSPSSGTYVAGDNFVVAVKINTDSPINAAEGNLDFSADLDDMEAVSISKSGSIFTIWTQDPVFSNSSGEIRFGGGVPNPGFIGNQGTIMTITFKVKTAGSATVRFVSGAILANDGKGTNILSSMNGGNYSFVPKSTIPTPIEKPPAEKPPVAKPKPAPDVPPSAPEISSQTHLDPAKWYSNNNPSFAWDLPSDVTGVSLKLDKKPDSDPGPSSDGLLKSKAFENIEDGVWYFHIKLRNKYGWSKITHRKVLIDTVLPKPFEIKIERENETDPQPILHFETTDETSGIEYYEVKIGEGESFPVNTEELKHNPYKMPLQAPGKYTIEVKAFDKAGNSTLAAGELIILPIEAPKITRIPKSIKIGDALTIEGEALPEITVRIFIQRVEKEPMMEKTKADLTGKFVFSYDKPLAKGDYVVWAQSEDELGALSPSTQKYSLEVGLPPFLKFGKIAVDYLTTMITLIVLIVGILVIIFYSWYRISLWRKRVRRETSEAEEKLHTAFLALREEIEEQVAKLDGQPGLSQRESEICEDLKGALKVSEEFIRKEIKDVEKELE